MYVNTLLWVHVSPDICASPNLASRFYRVGGDTRISGLMLAGATVVLLFIGTGPIAYIRTYSPPHGRTLSLTFLPLLACSCDDGGCSDLCARYRSCKRGSVGYETSYEPVGVYHDHQYHDLHDGMGFRDRSSVWNRHEL